MFNELYRQLIVKHQSLVMDIIHWDIDLVIKMSLQLKCFHLDFNLNTAEQCVLLFSLKKKNKNPRR